MAVYVDHPYRRGNRPRLAGTDRKMGFQARKSPSKKRAPNGRFVTYLCEECEDSGKVGCGTCQGSGIGVNGPVETSKCLDCKGSGSVPCPGEAHEEGTHGIR